MLPIPTKFWRAMNILARLPMVFAAVALFFMMGLTFFDVVLRSAFNNPIQASTELTRILMAAIVFSSLPMVSAKGDHIVVDLLDSFFSPTAAIIRDGIIYVVFGGLLFFPANRVMVLAERAREFGNATEYLNLPQFFVAYFIFGSIVVTALAMLLHGILLLFNIGPNTKGPSTENYPC